MSMMEYGVQIFGCLREFREDPEAFFRRLAGMGYRQIEPCVLFGDASGVPEALRRLLWKPEEVPGFQALLERFGMELTSCHVFCADLPAAAQEMLNLAEKSSVHTYVVNCPGHAIAEEYPAFARTLRELAERPSVQAVFAVELSLGQMVEDVRLAVEGRRPVGFFGRAGGVIPTPHEIAQHAMKFLEGR